MKKINRYKIYGFFLIFTSVLTIIPLKLISEENSKLFLYAVISWASMLIIGFFLHWWCIEMDELNELEVIKKC